VAGFIDTEPAWTRDPSGFLRLPVGDLHPNGRPRYVRHFVYYAAKEGLIKIGATIDVRSRVAELKAELLAWEPSGYTRMIEGRRHDQFRHLRADPSGWRGWSEWHYPGPDLLEFIDVLAEANPGVPDPDPRCIIHGTLSAYGRFRCRCDECRAVVKAKWAATKEDHKLFALPARQ
jgi:hypothetical protein